MSRTMTYLDTTEAEQHAEADRIFGPCLRPDCPNAVSETGSVE